MKRAIDIFVVILCLILLGIPLLFLVLQIRRKIGSPIFFRQIRPGLNGRLFEMVKFRSMLNTCNEEGQLLCDFERLTEFGRFLRSTSLDELPGLWSVLKGDMSLVGPRPLLPQYLPLYSLTQARRHEVKPGITGWAQVNGRNALSWDEKFELDVWYVDNRSLWLDIKILLMTIRKVFLREDVNAKGETPMSPFTGSNA